MSFKLELHETAEEELWEAVDYYDEKRNRLGKEFARELQTVMKNVREHPARFPKVKGNIQKAVLSRFPYNIIFEVRGDLVFVLSIFHTSRNPKIWQERV